MSVLVPMSETAFSQYVESAIAGYAEQNVTSGRWAAADALDRSRAEHEKLLPGGLATPDNYLFEIRNAEGTETVGALWLGVVERAGVRIAFIFDVRVDEPCRGQGHAKGALKALEPFVRSLGLSTIGLHVFAYNTGARALYESLGYGTTSINMHKHLGSTSA